MTHRPFAFLAALIFASALSGAAAQTPEPPAASPPPEASATPAPQTPPPPQAAPEPQAPPQTPPPQAAAPPPKPPETEVKAVPFSEAICPLIESSAAANNLPVEFFTRLIWRESSFRSYVVSPVGAQGVAQFMPGTAADRGLMDPFDPAQALPKSAELLRDLRAQFGNLGLAAAAYNAGPRRVQEWLAGTGGLPAETRDYVLIVTGRTAEEWSAIGAREPEAAGPNPLAPMNCAALAAIAAAEGRRSADVVLTPEGKPPIVARVMRPGARGAEPWGVQLAGNFSQAAALNSFVAMQRQYSQVLAGRTPVVVASRWRHRGTRMFYRVRIGARTRENAEQLCNKLRAVGGGCLVSRN